MSGLRSRLGSFGLEVAPCTPRPDGAEPWRLILALSAWGRDEVMLPVRAAEIAAQENRVELRRPGIVEWYVND